MSVIKLAINIRTPNIRGFGSSPRYIDLNQFDSGAMANQSKGPANAPIGGNVIEGWAQGFNANLSKSIYKDSITTVQPSSIQLLIIIKI